MNVSKSMLLGVAFISLSTGLLIPPLFQVYVTNFPLDEGGNLKVSISEMPLQTYNDSIEITVLHMEQGIVIEYNPDHPNIEINHPLMLTFALSSKPRFQNVTDVWISLVVEDPENDLYMEHFKLDFTFNDASTYHMDKELKAVGEQRIITLQVSDEYIHRLIVPSINTITLTNPEVRRVGVFRYYSMRIYKMTVFIEYGYQA